ncbi:asparagine synthase (glutamine-hydrolyzing) [Nocardia donostiensis]|uniref:asparagine synthase (glutamine-hydrolyzing) n=1 Tax=Nocardia donostiensis TaxID=1538463 RepID=UPI0009D9C047|nr:asparagine synthase (glutamine-hydrolyzing) [Nocardia donostiensis]OQS12443.1 asparagine synthase (glutamine-hydrolyzing) [Nocardia donostiensis]
MCGITGFVSWSGLHRDGHAVVARMTEQLQHRGPDGSGCWTSTHAAFGHTRLSIIDLAHGAQPMTLGDRPGHRLVLTYNGELYNFRALRSTLQSHGRVFHTDSDTEVVLQAFAEWGPQCVDRFTGMFAFAIWDEHAHRLTLARDPLGVKPLFYLDDGAQVLFGSEEKAILVHPTVEPVLDETGVAELFCMAPMVNRDRAVLRGFRQVEPGHIMTFGPHGSVSRCYWRLEARPHRADAAATATRVRELLQESVSGQLVSDVRVGAMLSGGVDSSALSAMAMAEYTGGPLATYDIDFAPGDTNYSSSALHIDRDAPWAAKVAAHIGSHHSTCIVDTDDLLAAEGHTLRIWGRPMHRPANVSLYLLFRHIRDTGTTVVVGGEGADEAFAGYAWWRSTAADGFAWQDVFRESVGLLRPEFASSPRFRDYARDSHATARARVPRLSTDSPDDRRAREISWMTYTFYLDYLLHRVDRMSMAAGVEARVPFCDHELVQYAWNVPWELKNHGGIEKGILRMAIADLLPNEVTYRRKSGYPMAQTASYQRAQYDAARAVLADRHAPVWQIVDPSAVTDIVGRSGVANNSDWTDLNRIAYVLETDSWLRDLRVRVL